ncbi:CbtA family protein [Herbaspirillum sp. RTI4]|uniref:CbtA family protein n=1 Tax=Herbaspirillum sp. RTI4 TaxID=3048640 RepID=UPI002AB48D12|nr:CbtA family protein [Herbaspirillum sp. RTI4]MDY7578971.1 CbtA family protein [Herbaspirillum sp. RTI4]MEA9980902.1 CbtA family protein [Herbaspirillum sp. RTI4]
MTGKLLLRGMLAGIVAGLLAFGFAKTFGEPQVDQAISFEEKINADKAAAHEHAHAVGEVHEHEHEHGLVSRSTQAGIGLLTGVVVYGAAVGGLFALVFAYAYGRIGKLGARPLAAWLALAAFVALTLVPYLKYPANPPSIGDPDTIRYRTGLYFLMIAISIAVTAFAFTVRRYAAARTGAWNGTIIAGGVFIAVIAAVQLSLPELNEVPEAFPAVLLWKFRIAAIGMQVILWTAIGVLFGWLAERLERTQTIKRLIGKPAY